MREISVETTETILIRSSGQAASFWCGGCGMKTEMSSVEEAAVALNVSSRSVYRWIESGKVHFCEPERGILRVCLRSLSLLPEFRAETKDN